MPCVCDAPTWARQTAVLVALALLSAGAALSRGGVRDRTTRSLRIDADARSHVTATVGDVAWVPLTRRAGFGPRFGDTTLGRGEPVVSLDAVNGDVRVSVFQREQASDSPLDAAGRRVGVEPAPGVRRCPTDATCRRFASRLDCDA